MKTIQIIVSGRVQGVYFRSFTQKQAIKHGITGLVRNKADQTVEIVASAEQDKLISWCHTEPMMAKVSKVIVNEYELIEKYTQFKIL